VTATIDHLVYACPDLGEAVDRIGAQAGVRPALLHRFRPSSPGPKRLAARLRALGLDLDVERAGRPALGAVLLGPEGQRVVLGCWRG
jgi:hypothetical protein